MSCEVRVDQHFSSAHLGNALAKLWTVNGLTLELIDVAYSCAFTTERPANPGMTEDGHVYSWGNITRWLIDKDTSPNTNATLTHKRVMRLLPLKEVIEIFFAQCKAQRFAARAQFEATCRRSCMEATQHNQMQTEIERLDSYIKSCMKDLEAWIQHLEVLRQIKHAFQERIVEWRRLAAIRIQTKWRSCIAILRTRSERLRRATILIQSSCRSFLALHRVATGRCRSAALPIRSAVRSFDARLRLLRLMEQRDKANLQLVKTVRNQAGDTCSLVSVFLQRNADVNCADVDGSTPLSLAVVRGDAEVVKILCDAGANLNDIDRKSCTALLHSCFRGHDQCTQALLGHLADVNFQNNSGVTALMVACKNGHDQCTQALIDHEADVNIRNNFAGTALMMASKNGHDKCTRALIAATADTNCARPDGWTALMSARSAGHIQCARALIEATADLDK